MSLSKSRKSYSCGQNSLSNRNGKPQQPAGKSAIARDRTVDGNHDSCNHQLSASLLCALPHALRVQHPHRDVAQALRSHFVEDVAPLVASVIFSTIWSVTLYCSLSPIALSTAWAASSLPDMSTVPMVSLMPISLSTLSMASPRPDKAPDTVVAASLVFWLSFALSSTELNELPTLPVTSYLSFK